MYVCIYLIRFICFNATPKNVYTIMFKPKIKECIVCSMIIISLKIFTILSESNYEYYGQSTKKCAYKIVCLIGTM